jgi:phosphatidylglycerol lysyltransferase
MYRRAFLTLGLGGLFLGLLSNRLHAVDPGQVLQAFGRVDVFAWIGAALATAGSYWAVAGYDQALHRHLATGVAPARARRAGLAAIAISQTVGMGVISGALVRWRMLPELGPWGAMRLSLAVAVSFLLAWAVLTSVALAVVPVIALPAIPPWAVWVIVVTIVTGLVICRDKVPNLVTLSRMFLLAAIDCAGAGLALWLLFPGDLAIAAFLPVFLVALGAGLLSGSPAGLGAFEITLLALLPGAAEAEVLAAALAWRVLYHALPALIGAGISLWVWPETEVAAGRASPKPPEIGEAGLVDQGELFTHPAGFVAGRTLHGLVALSAVADHARFLAAARAEARWPILYKAGGREAARARKAGLLVLPLAFEARLFPQAFRLDLPELAGLRRKLRRAEAAGVTADLETRPDWSSLAALNAAWVQARGAERGFSMGRFEPRYLVRQRLVVARLRGRITGFASFHVAMIRGEEVWTLDLLRPDPDATDGTAQLLIAAAIAAARERGVRRLSLAAVPVGSQASAPGLIARLGRALAPSTMRGLCQFKGSFAPYWQPLYIAGPSWLALAIAGLEILCRVRRPLPLTKLNRASRQNAEYEFAYGRGPWQRGRDKAA